MYAKMTRMDDDNTFVVGNCRKKHKTDSTHQVREVDTDLLSPSTLLSANYIVFVILLATFALVIILVITGVVSSHC